MKNDRLFSAIWGAVLGALVSLASVSCLGTGFFLEYDAWSLLLWCAAGAVLGALFTWLKLELVPFCAFALLIGILWKDAGLSRSLETLVFSVSFLYDNGYGIGILRWTDAPLTDPSLALCVWGCGIGLLLSWSVTRGQDTWLALPLSLIPALVCLGLTNTVPRELYLYLLLTGVVLILLTQASRRADAFQSNWLTALLALPVALAVGLLFLLNPQAGYDKQAGAQQLEDWVMQWVDPEDPTQETTDDAPVFSVFSPQQVDLSDTGPLRHRFATVMRVRAQQSGPLYLRGRAYDSYDGLSWQASEGTWPLDTEYTTTDQVLELTVQTLRVQDALFLPYVAWDRTSSGLIENTQGQTSYTVSYSPLAQGSVSSLPAPREADLAPYLTLPEGTLRQAQLLLPELSGEPWQDAQAIARQVQASALYDLRTRTMPDGSEDFALWFLEESDTGYCVHFATATVVLLRSAGIPARYVTGYLIDARAGETVDVRDKDAHAWVECYIDGMGWILLEPTPSSGTSPVVSTRPSEEAVLPTLSATVPGVPNGAAPTDATDATVTTSAVGGADAPSEIPEEPQAHISLGPWLLSIGLCLGLAGAVVGQWRIRLYLRAKKQRMGTTNAQALALWQEVSLHCRLRRQTPDAQLLRLAQKAKFSQHAITDQELALFHSWLKTSREGFRRRSFCHQLVYTLLWALY